MTKLDFAADLADVARLVGVANQRLGFENLIHAAHRSHAALKDVDHPAEGDHRPDEIAEIERELHELADGDAAARHGVFADDQRAAVPEHGDEAEADEELQDRMKDARQLNQAQVAIDRFAVDFAEAFDLGAL